MDTKQCQEAIYKIEMELDLHDTKFADNPVHANCRTRFLNVLASLRNELADQLIRPPQANSQHELNFEPDDLGQIDFHPGRNLFNDRKPKKMF